MTSMENIKIIAISPTLGAKQVFIGTRNGIWVSGFLHDGVAGKIHSYNNKRDAFQAFDANSDVLRFHNNEETQNDSPKESSN